MGKSDAEKPGSSSKSKKERTLFPTKVVIRRLPPSLTEDQLREEFGGFPEHDFFYFVGGDMSFGPMCFSRAYINFKNRDDIVNFRDQYDGYRFVDNRGVEYHAVVEYAPFQGVPKKKSKKDPKNGTISEDPDYLAFLESLKETSEPPASIEAHLEEIEAKKASSISTKISTPLLEYVKMKKSCRGRPISARAISEKKRRLEREELSRSPKKSASLSSSSNKDSGTKRGQLSLKEEKAKDEKKDMKSKEDGRREEKMDKKGSKETKANPPSRDKQESKSPSKGKEERTRPESGRHGKRPDRRRSEDRRQDVRRASNQKDRRDSTDREVTDRGRYERYRKESGNESKQRDLKPGSRRDTGSESEIKDRESLSKKYNSDKDIKQGKEQGSSTTRESKESTAVSVESKHPTEEAKGPAKDEKKRRESERRIRNKDRPDRAIYQPRTSSRGGPRQDTPKAMDTVTDKEKGKGKEKGHETDHDTQR